MTTTRSIVSKSETIKDTAYPYSLVSIPFYTANFHVVDFDVYYGDGAIMSSLAKAGAVIELENGNLKDIFFKNANAGDIATVNVTMSIPNPDTKKELKL